MDRRRAALLLAAAALFFHWRVLFDPAYALPWDLRNYHLPLAAAVADSIAEGEFPYWEPYSYCGRPLASNPQAAVFYPTVALAAAFGREGLLDRLEWNVAFHVWLGGWFAFLLARRRGLSMQAAVCAGLIYELGGFFASQSQHMGSVMAAAWLPLAWEGAHLGSRWRMTLAFVMAILAGFTPMALVVSISTLLFRPAAWACWSQSALAAAALTAVQLGPAWDLMQESVAQYRTDWMGSGGGLPWQSLASLIAPWQMHGQQFEPTHLYIFCGWIGLGLALSAVRREPRLAALTALFALAMLGETTPFGRILFAIQPGFLQRAFYWYPFLAAFTLGVAQMAGSGVTRGGWIVAALLTVELTLAGAGRPMNTQSLIAEPGLAAAEVDAVRALAGDGRIDTIGESQLWSSSAPLIRLRSANGYDPLALERLMQVRLTMAHGERWGAFYQIERPRAASLGVLGIQAVVAREPGPADSDGLRKAGELPGRVLYQAVRPLARVHGVVRVRPARDMAGAAGMLRAADFDPAAEAIVEGIAPVNPTAAEFLEASQTRHTTRVRVSSSGGAFIVMSDAFWKGWRARIDGRPAALYAANVATRGVWVPPGRHVVDVEIDRWRFWRWSLLSAAALLFLGLRRARR